MEKIEETVIDGAASDNSPAVETLPPPNASVLPQASHFEEAAAASKVLEEKFKEFSLALDVFPGSRRQMMRSWYNAAMAPLNKEPLQWSYEVEKELFDIYTELEGAKFILMVHGLHDAGLLTLHKPLMQSTAATQSEVELKETMNKLTGGETIDLGNRELPKIEENNIGVQTT